jgi:hypothetical protein
MGGYKSLMPASFDALAKKIRFEFLSPAASVLFLLGSVFSIEKVAKKVAGR